MNWTAVGFSQSVVTDPLALPLVNGIRYFFSVRAYNRVSLFAQVNDTGGVLIDFVGPTVHGVYDGSAIDAASGALIQTSYFSTTQLSVQWNAFISASNITGYAVGFGSQPGATDVMPLITLQPPARILLL
jgi:hypothetical protein